MGIFAIKLPDIGEGVAEAELVEWLVEIGQTIKEDAPLAAVMTDKATVEIPSPVSGTVSWLGPAIGETVAVGTEIIRLDVSGEGNVTGHPPVQAETNRNNLNVETEEKDSGHLKSEQTEKISEFQGSVSVLLSSPVLHAEEDTPLASPAVRKRAREAGIDLSFVGGTGPAARITQKDLNDYIEGRSAGFSRGLGQIRNTDVNDIKVVGLRRKIAEKMTIAKSRIPHITYIDEIDVTELESLRQMLNADRSAKRPKLTLLPFLMQAMLVAIKEMPQMNARFDDEAGIIHQFGGVHFGIATQTSSGLVVPVVRHGEALNLWEMAAEISRVTAATREGKAAREELSGSTITITSLGALGGLATTPVINHPEVSIIGVNKIRTAPVWDGQQFRPRQIMNLSSSFDHRVIDGWDAALFIQRIKTLVESPALIFLEEQR